MAVQDAVAKLRNQEQEMKARAEASERLSSEIIASMTAGLIVVGGDGAIRTINPAARRLLDAPAAVNGMSYEDLPARAAPLSALIRAGIAAERPIVRQTLQLPRTESETGPTHLGVTVSPIVGTTPPRQGVICLFTDLTAVAQLEDQLRLRESLATVGEMTAGIAHEFRNGLATIHGYGRLMDAERLPVEYRPYLSAIREETDALSSVVTKFLNFARPATLALDRVDLSALVDRAADEVRTEVRSRGGDVEITGVLPQIEADEVLLKQAFTNLLRNAFESCTAHGVIPRITVDGTLDAAQNSVRVRVTDNGAGVPAANRARVFQPFFTTKPAGTGLGLAIVQKILVTHGGRVTVVDSPLGGGCFQVMLPVNQRQPGAPL